MAVRRTIFVTGGGSSIGLALVALLATPLAGQNNEAGDARRSQPSAQQRDKGASNPPSEQASTGARLARPLNEIGEAKRAQDDPYRDERNEREKRDLIAQQEMADWAVGVFWATLAGVVIASLAFFGLLFQIGENRRSTKQQLRAYLSTEPLGIKSRIGRKDCLGHILLKNVGQTPAFNVWLKVMLTRHTEKEWQPVDYADDPLKVSRALHPGGSMSQGSQGPFLNIAEIDVATKNAELPYIYIWGIARYDDIYGERHTTKFCYRYETGSREQQNVTRINVLMRNGPPEALVIFKADKARLQSHGNDAD